MDKERQARVMLFVVGLMEELKDQGLMTGGYEMSDEGRREYLLLVESGFLPTDEEIAETTRLIYLTAGTPEANAALGGELS